jgi:hypothetical protein
VALDRIVTHHVDAHRSGVARFNHLLAERLGVPVIALARWEPRPGEHPLLSFKAAELPADARDRLLVRLRDMPPGGLSLFLHAWTDSELERALLARAARVLCGNAAVHAAVAPRHPAAESLWAPGLLLERRPFASADVTIFSFGMAHKLQTARFARLRALLDASGASWTLRISSADHETATLEEGEAVAEEMRRIVPRGLCFLGNLSDAAVADELARASCFAAFFEGGARANNTSIASAMELGTPVVTNLDAHSPPDLVHMETVIDIERCSTLPLDPAALRELGARGRAAAAGRSWERLVERIAS